MVKKIIFPIIILLLIAGFYASENFELIAVGVAVLIFGISLLETGFRNSAEGGLKRVLQSVGGSFGKSFGLGFSSTIVFQSSSLITIVAISFLSAGLLTLKSGMGIVFGSNLGTTATSWLVSLLGLKLQLSKLAAPFIVFGVLLYFQKKKKGLESFGHILLGLGFFFTGIFVMQEGFNEMQGSISLDSVASSGIVRNLLFLGIGILLTLILQSSSASMAIVLTALYEGQIQYMDGLTLAIGANVGTTITAVIGSAAANYAGKQVAAGHLIFNFVTGILAVVLLPIFIKIVDLTASGLGIADNDYTLKLSVFHTFFNLAGIIVMAPFINQFCSLLERLIPHRVEPMVKPKFINESILEFPQGAFLAVVEEEKALFEDSKSILLKAIGISKSQLTNISDIEGIISRDAKIKSLSVDEEYTKLIKPIYSEILKYAELLQNPGFAQDVRYVSRKMVSCLKDMDELHQNIREKCMSNNGIVKQEYDRFRFLIATTIYETNLVNDQQSLDSKMDRLETLRTEAKKNESQVGSSIHSWIVQKKITSEEVSSMLNDAHYTYNICRNLGQVTIGLFSGKHVSEKADNQKDIELANVKSD